MTSLDRSESVRSEEGEGGARKGGRVRVDLIGERSEVGTGVIKLLFHSSRVACVAQANTKR